MYNLPSRRRRKNTLVRPNLIPILDAVFIFIFFLLMSANFVQMFEINSNVPIVSNSEPPKSKKPPLALTIKIDKNALMVYSGVPAKLIKKISNNKPTTYDLESLHSLLLDIKSKNPEEKTVIFEANENVAYEQIVQIMDSTRLIRHTDPEFYIKDKNGINIKVKELFSDIIFGNVAN